MVTDRKCAIGEPGTTNRAIFIIKQVHNSAGIEAIHTKLT